MTSSRSGISLAGCSLLPHSACLFSRAVFLSVDTCFYPDRTRHRRNKTWCVTLARLDICRDEEDGAGRAKKEKILNIGKLKN